MTDIHACDLCDFRFADLEDTTEIHDECFTDLLEKAGTVDHLVYLCYQADVDIYLDEAIKPLDGEVARANAAQELQDLLQTYR